MVEFVPWLDRRILCLAVTNIKVEVSESLGMRNTILPQITRSLCGPVLRSDSHL